MASCSASWWTGQVAAARIREVSLESHGTNGIHQNSASSMAAECLLDPGGA